MHVYDVHLFMFSKILAVNIIEMNSFRFRVTNINNDIMENTPIYEKYHYATKLHAYAITCTGKKIC